MWEVFIKGKEASEWMRQDWGEAHQESQGSCSDPDRPRIVLEDRMLTGSPAALQVTHRHSPFFIAWWCGLVGPPASAHGFQVVAPPLPGGEGAW